MSQRLTGHRGSRALAHLVQALVLFACLLSAAFVQAEDVARTFRIELLLSDHNGPYQAVADTLKQGLPETDGYRLNRHVAERGVSWHASGTPDLIVTIGALAADALTQVPESSRVLQLLIPSTHHHLATDAVTHSGHSTIFIDQPVERQLNLIRLVLPGIENIGLLLGVESQAQRAPLESAIESRNWHAHTSLASESGHYLGPLRRLLDQSEVLLAVPDRSVFNRHNLQGILLSSYRREVPLIGFSPGYVRAGALAAVYSTPQQIARQATEWIQAQAGNEGAALPATSYPAYFSATVNQQVAKSLGLRIPDEAALLNGLRELDGGTP